MRKLFVVAVAAVLSGCSFSPSADVLKALSNDPATICWTITTPWGGSSLDRNHGCGQAPAASPVIIMPGNIPVQMIRP